MNIGTTKTVQYEYVQRECEVCGEPAMHRLTFLLENARYNPASAGYHKDDVSWCSDAEAFACNEHEQEVRQNAPEGMGWCSDFYVKTNSDGTLSNQHFVCYWKKTSEVIHENPDLIESGATSTEA